MRVASYKSMQVLYHVNSYYKWKVQLKITFIDKHDMAAFNFRLHPWPTPIPCVKNRNDLLCNHMNNFRPHKGRYFGLRAGQYIDLIFLKSIVGDNCTFSGMSVYQWNRDSDMLSFEAVWSSKFHYSPEKWLILRARIFLSFICKSVCKIDIRWHT